MRDRPFIEQLHRFCPERSSYGPSQRDADIDVCLHLGDVGNVISERVSLLGCRVTAAPTVVPFVSLE